MNDASNAIIEDLEIKPNPRLAWLKWRQNFIGSSDAAAIHGLSPYKTPIEIYEDKTTEEFEEEEENFAMARGNQYEPISRKLFAAEYNIENLTDESFAARTVESADVPYLSASLDGCTEDGITALTEYKYQGAEAHGRVSNETLDVKGGRVPLHYWIQIQHQLLVTGAKVCWFVSYNPKAAQVLKKVAVLPDEQFMIEHLKVCENFWLNHVVPRVPPPPTDKDYVTLTKKGAKKIAKRMAFLKEKLNEYEAEYEEAKTQLLAMVDHPKMRVGQLRIVEISRAGSIDYKKIPAVQAMSKAELESYRGKGTTFKKVDLEKTDDGK